MTSIVCSVRECHNNWKRSISFEHQCYEHNTKQVLWSTIQLISTTFQSDEAHMSATCESRCFVFSAFNHRYRSSSLEGSGYKLYGAPKYSIVLCCVHNTAVQVKYSSSNYCDTLEVSLICYSYCMYIIAMALI